nr:DUF4246 [Penicillium meliponae]
MKGYDLPAPAQDGLPGFTLPVNYIPPEIPPWSTRPIFPHALQFMERDLKVYREILMMRVMNSITDKPDWDQKVFNEEITSKWRKEISESGQDVSTTMMDFVIGELQWRAELLKINKSVNVFTIGVEKSDTAISDDLKKALIEAAAPLEDVPEDQKDYHPGSDQKVVDLVHPSLFPLVYEHTRILRDEVITLDNCLGTTGQGEVLPTPSKVEIKSRWTGMGRENDSDGYSIKFQWLPCDVSLFSQEGDSGCRIISYINNLHPKEYRPLYGVIEKILDCVIPLWSQSLSIDARANRIEWDTVEYESDQEEEEPEQGPEEDDDTYWERHWAWQTTQKIEQPEPGSLQKFKLNQTEKIDIRELFGKTGLQVIVKMANIELTPEKPEYEGGSWHVEGQLNERICATAIYYYDCENITESTLAFRHRANEGQVDDVGYEQSRHEFLQQIYGFGTHVESNYKSQLTQDLGAVVCREGRLLTFPNIVQHRVSPFSLADPTKPGHRKILAFFLVDPHLKIISTANIPPQQMSWGAEKAELTRGVIGGRLPVELQDMVLQEGVLQPLMTMDEAKKFRLELMEERSVKAPNQNEAFEMGSFCLCEH